MIEGNGDDDDDDNDDHNNNEINKPYFNCTNVHKDSSILEEFQRLYCNK